MQTGRRHCLVLTTRVFLMRMINCRWRRRPTTLCCSIRTRTKSSIRRLRSTNWSLHLFWLNAFTSTDRLRGWLSKSWWQRMRSAWSYSTPPNSFILEQQTSNDCGPSGLRIGHLRRRSLRKRTCVRQIPLWFLQMRSFSQTWVSLGILV